VGQSNNYTRGIDSSSIKEAAMSRRRIGITVIALVLFGAFMVNLFSGVHQSNKISQIGAALDGGDGSFSSAPAPRV
jgi:hypothetical protein